MYILYSEQRLPILGRSIFDKWDVMTLSEFLHTKTGTGRGEEVWVKEHVRCEVCDQPLIRPDNGGEERFFRQKQTRGLYAVCSESCYNMYILKNL